jgi:hypothetical protein
MLALGRAQGVFLLRGVAGGARLEHQMRTAAGRAWGEPARCADRRGNPTLWPARSLRAAFCRAGREPAAHHFRPCSVGRRNLAFAALNAALQRASALASPRERFWRIGGGSGERADAPSAVVGGALVVIRRARGVVWWSPAVCRCALRASSRAISAFRQRTAAAVGQGSASRAPGARGRSVTSRGR